MVWVLQNYLFVGNERAGTRSITTDSFLRFLCVGTGRDAIKGPGSRSGSIVMSRLSAFPRYLFI